MRFIIYSVGLFLSVGYFYTVTLIMEQFQTIKPLEAWCRTVLFISA